MPSEWRICPDCKDEFQIEAGGDSNQQLACPKCGFKSIASRFLKATWEGSCPNCGRGYAIRLKDTGLKKCKCGHVCDVNEYKPIVRAQPAPRAKADATMVASTPSGSGFREVASLELIKGDCAPSKIWLKAGKNTIGRSAASSASMHQLQTSDTNIGRNHACIECVLRGDGSFEYSLSDLNSKNGTYRNGERLKEGDNLILQLNDKIGLGSQTIFQITMGG